MFFHYYERYIKDLKFIEIKPIITSSHQKESKYLKQIYFKDDDNNVYCWIITKLNRTFLHNEIYKIKFTISSFDKDEDVLYIQRPLFLTKVN